MRMVCAMCRPTTSKSFGLWSYGIGQWTVIVAMSWSMPDEALHDCATKRVSGSAPQQPPGAERARGELGAVGFVALAQRAVFGACGASRNPLLGTAARTAV